MIDTLKLKHWTTLFDLQRHKNYNRIIWRECACNKIGIVTEEDSVAIGLLFLALNQCTVLVIKPSIEENFKAGNSTATVVDSHTGMGKANILIFVDKEAKDSAAAITDNNKVEGLTMVEDHFKERELQAECLNNNNSIKSIIFWQVENQLEQHRVEQPGTRYHANS